MDEVGLGPSRIERFTLSDGATSRELLLVSCYDARNLWVIDPRVGALHTIAGFDGPFEMAIDEVSRRAYLVDFRSSFFWVIDLDPLLRVARSQDRGPDALRSGGHVASLERPADAACRLCPSRAAEAGRRLEAVPGRE